jgi:beta-mannosidase
MDEARDQIKSYLRQRHEKKGVTLSAQIQAEVWEKNNLLARLVVTSPNGKNTFSAEAPITNGQVDLSTLLRKPELWWPNGYGAQPLYSVKAAC